MRSNYVEPVELKPLLSGAFAGMTEALDPFSEYVPPDQMAAFTAWEASKEKKDVVDVGIVVARRFGFPVVVAAVEGGPAAAAGVKSDDVIEKVDGALTRNMALWELDAQPLRKGRRPGAAGSRPGGQAPPPDDRHRARRLVAGAPAAQRVDGETVVRIPSFTPGAAAAVKKILEPLDRTHALILDVSNNATGTYEEAARAAALFVAPGPLGELKGRKIESKTYRAEPGERVHESRLVVLVDSGTAGPAELFASALREATVRAAAPRRSSSGRTRRRRKTKTPSTGIRASIRSRAPRSSPCVSSGETTVGMASRRRSSSSRAAARSSSRSGRSTRSPARRSVRRASSPMTASSTGRRTKRRARAT